MPVLACVLAAVSAACIWWSPSLTSVASAAVATTTPLGVSTERPLSLVDEAVQVAISGRSLGSLEGARLVVRVKGPAEPSQVGQAAPELPEAGKIAVDLGATPTATIYTSPGDGAAGGVTDSTGAGGWNTTTTAAGRIGSLEDLRAGVLEAEVMIPSTLVTQPGAYLVVAEVSSAGELIGRGWAWVGKAPPREAPLDLAFVWPVSLGIHRDADGVFYDHVLEEAVSNVGAGADLRGLLELAGRFPEWRFTLAVEPVLLTQLRDMADGYTRLDESGAPLDVMPDAQPALDAAEVMAAFKALGERGAAEVLAGPYSGADLDALAGEGWGDGLQQLQLGKQELQQSLGLAAPPQGGYPPDLALTSDSLSYYAQSSIDHVIVTDTLAALLTEPVAAGTDAVRARNADNDRLTLVFADSGLGARMTSLWDAGVLAAALAARLATKAEEAIVLTPNIGYRLVPAGYLDSVGRMLEGAGWVRTQTLTGLLRAHGPDTRPVLLQAPAAMPGGYIEESLRAGLRVAHTAVGDLVAMADPTRAPVEEVLRLLFIAQSRWWSRAETSPLEATIGMAYADKAREMAEREMEKVRFLDSRPASIVGSEGTVQVVVQNDAGYPLNVKLGLEATGVTLPEGDSREVAIAPGRTEIPVRVTGTGAPYELRATLRTGSRTLDEAGYALRFITVMTVLPWAIAAGVIVALALFLVVYRSRRRRRRATTA